MWQLIRRSHTDLSITAMMRSFRLTTLLSLLAVGVAGAQSSGPPAAVPAPEPRLESTFYVPLYGAMAGITLPGGKLAEDHTAGYGFGGTIEYAVAGQPYSLRGEATYERFPLRSGHAGHDTNLLSLGSTVVFRLQESGGVPTSQRASGGTFVSGGIGVYNATDDGTRPGFNLGGGVEIPLTGFSAVAEARAHFILTDARAMVAIPLTVSVRF
jgi:hypothetical protein